ncbi:hypothetical protein SAMN04489761_0725 [Tenacibaculum sp. MAR_2009_124]|uniref:hypothetical protein n=1 Tax=Tenacibaculum sp. MAR_2009_124 TaxID=1250059 RepID=UPI0008947672|nr:hypothetical protein [Tenacibaculum sp. MAR_2009_124]SEB43988.1 hypothetical protein SAMN04489761_0725 [Tenacibaculum sp. MAR_2009_124]
MKLLLVVFSFVFITLNEVPEHVLDYHKADTKEKEIVFIKKYKLSNKKSIQGYVVSLQMKQAKHKFFPWKKLAVFNEGKRKLEKLIKENPNNTDLRYLRLVIQENIPALLNYRSSIENDKEFLSEKLKEKDNSDYLDFYIKKNTSL